MERTSLLMILPSFKAEWVALYTSAKPYREPTMAVSKVT